MKYPENYINKIIHGDCLNVMKGIPDNLIDLIILDPPYNIKKADWDKWKTVESYVNYMGSVFSECERVLKDNGSFYFFHNDFMQIVELQNWLNNNSKFIFKQLITWSKISENFDNYGYVQQRLSIDMSRNYYNGFTEYILYYTFQIGTGDNLIKNNENLFKSLKSYMSKIINNNKSEIIEKLLSYYSNIDIVNLRLKNFTGDQEFRLIPKKAFNCISIYFDRNYSDLKKEYDKLKSEYKNLIYTFNNQVVKENLRSNSNTWVYPPVGVTDHITEKPIQLIENIILHSSNKGDLILDPMCGSGTVCSVSKKTHRNFIGIEKIFRYYKISLDRISQGVIFQ
jgi:site-specific DNA-methyltransferase (adenine-specific)